MSSTFRMLWPITFSHFAEVFCCLYSHPSHHCCQHTNTVINSIGQRKCLLQCWIMCLYTQRNRATTTYGSCRWGMTRATCSKTSANVVCCNKKEQSFLSSQMQVLLQYSEATQSFTSSHVNVNPVRISFATFQNLALCYNNISCNGLNMEVFEGLWRKIQLCPHLNIDTHCDMSADLRVTKCQILYIWTMFRSNQDKWFPVSIWM